MDKHIEIWVNKKINEMEPSQRDIAVGNIIREEVDIFQVYMGCAERLIKSLFLLNSGGVVTLLAYLHDKLSSVDVDNQVWCLSISLRLFILGLMSAFFLVVADYFFLGKRLFNYMKQSREFLDDKISFSKINRFAGVPDFCCEKILYFFCVMFMGGVSVLSAVFGILVGLYAYQLV